MVPGCRNTPLQVRAGSGDPAGSRAFFVFRENWMAEASEIIPLPVSDECCTNLPTCHCRKPIRYAVGCLCEDCFVEATAKLDEIDTQSVNTLIT